MNSQRKHERYDYEQDIQLVSEDGETYYGRLQNFSMGGAFVQLATMPEFGSKVILHIDLPGVPDTCKIPCFVRWTKPNVGAGIQFEYTRPIEVWALSKLIRRLKDETGA